MVRRNPEFDPLVHFSRTREELAADFLRVFGKMIRRYGSNPFTGFDVVAFETEMVKDCGDDESLREAIRRKWGEDGETLIMRLVSHPPARVAYEASLRGDRKAVLDWLNASGILYTLAVALICDTEGEPPDSLFAVLHVAAADSRPVMLTVGSPEDAAAVAAWAAVVPGDPLVLRAYVNGGHVRLLNSEGDNVLDPDTPDCVLLRRM